MRDKSPKPHPTPAVAITGAPRCRSYLSAKGVTPPYLGYSDWLLAEEIAASFSTNRLIAYGIDFWVMDGGQLIDALEKMLESGLHGNVQSEIGRRYQAAEPADPALRRIKSGFSAQQIDNMRSRKGGWGRAELARMGVSWPAPKGWRQRLIDNYETRRKPK